MDYRYYLFDFDGTLVDSMPTYVSVMLRILDEHGVLYGDDIMKIITPLGYAGAAKYFLDNFKINSTQEDLIKKMHSYALAAYRDEIEAKSNVVYVLHELKARSCSLNVLTASPHEMLDPCLKRLGIFDLFDNIWSCEDFNTTKADPKIYRMAAERIGADMRQILFLDDNYNADLSAKNAGMPVCGVFDPSSKEYENEIRSITDHYITDFIELL
ncbi:MAG: HAD family phosphatase [Clostridiales bacterium]|nr:HAD family phosphatase [Clostridiales bacterium]